MLGGMWGVLRTQSREAWKDVWENIWSAIIADPISQSDRGTKGPDQILLSRHIWGQLSGGVICNTTVSLALGIQLTSALHDICISSNYIFVNKQSDQTRHCLAVGI